MRKSLKMRRKWRKDEIIREKMIAIEDKEQIDFFFEFYFFK